MLRFSPHKTNDSSKQYSRDLRNWWKQDSRVSISNNIKIIIQCGIIRGCLKNINYSPTNHHLTTAESCLIFIYLFFIFNKFRLKVVSHLKFMSTLVLLASEYELGFSAYAWVAECSAFHSHWIDVGFTRKSGS